MPIISTIFPSAELWLPEPATAPITSTPIPIPSLPSFQTASASHLACQFNTFESFEVPARLRFIVQSYGNGNGCTNKLVPSRIPFPFSFRKAIPIAIPITIAVPDHWH